MQSNILATVVLRLTVNNAEQMFIQHHARQAGLSQLDFIRRQLGLGRRPLGRATADQVATVEDEAYCLLQQIGVDPAPYFPDPVPQGQPTDAESPSDRVVRIARLRAVRSCATPLET